jgi:uncharacterized protein YheU (UPF0270 family)
MSQLAPEVEELRISIERLRTLLENLVVRGLRACGRDELVQLQSFTQHLEQSGAGHVAAVLAELHEQIQKDDRTAARTLLKAQTSVRVLERLLTLRVVKGQYQAVIAAMDQVAEAGNKEEDED